MSQLLEVRDAARSYRRGPETIHAVRGAQLELSAGEALALVGPSGSGKTTLMNLIVGWERLEGGSVSWRPPVDDPRRWDQVAVVPQRLGLLHELTIGQNVRWPLRLGRREPPADAEVEALEERLGLAALRGRRITEVSLGEQQRTAIARALVADPRVVVADEPTGHQDAASAEAVFAVLDDARARGTALLVATHDRRYLTHADGIVRMRDGTTTSTTDRTGQRLPSPDDPA